MCLLKGKKKTLICKAYPPRYLLMMDGRESWGVTGAHSGCTFTRCLFYFFNNTEDEVPWILQSNYIGKSVLESVMIFESHEYVFKEERNFCKCKKKPRQARDKLRLIFSVLRRFEWTQRWLKE